MNFFTVSAIGLGIIVLYASILAASAGLLMVLLGMFAHAINHLEFAIGFWPCYIIALIISLFFNTGNKSQ